MIFLNTLSRFLVIISSFATIELLTAYENRSGGNDFEIIEPINTSLDTAITHIACGSCYRATSKNAEVWDVIGSSKPQLFLFMGDNIYGDTKDMAVMKANYAKLTGRKSFQKFAKEAKILATWDDHDYGENDAGVEYPKKKESQQIFLDVHGFAKDHPARNQEGIYHSFSQGSKGKRLQVINLDTRYHRSPLIKQKNGKRKLYIPNTDPNATILGDAQWQWLEAELRKPADLRIIVSSIQIITVDHGYEKWSNIPAERMRFFDLLKKTNANRVILLSGDRHLAEFSKIKPEESGLAHDVIEMTASGLTHAGAWDNGNSHRIEGSYYRGRNFGTIDIHWSEDRAPKVTLKIKSLQEKSAEVFRETTVDFK